MATTKLAFIVEKLPYKSETSRLALTHAIASQSVEIYLEDDDMVEPVLAFVGDGVLNCLKNQKAMDHYSVTSMEMHNQNALLLDLKVLVCREDLERLGLAEENIVMEWEEMGAEVETEVVPFDKIQDEMGSSDHILWF